MLKVVLTLITKHDQNKKTTITKHDQNKKTTAFPQCV